MSLLSPRAGIYAAEGLLLRHLPALISLEVRWLRNGLAACSRFLQNFSLLGVVDYHADSHYNCGMYAKTLQLPELLEKKSFFLFGPRSTGKSTLVTQHLPGAKTFDLLDPDVFRDLLRYPKLLGEGVTDTKQIIVVDEVQKLPALLDEVHRLIERRKLRFLLTGSSARKLRRGAAVE